MNGFLELGQSGLLEKFRKKEVHDVNKTISNTTFDYNNYLL